MVYQHPADLKEATERQIAEAIWRANEGIPRLLHEITRPHSTLHKQQERCWKQARAVYAVLYPNQ